MQRPAIRHARGPLLPYRPDAHGIVPTFEGPHRHDETMESLYAQRTTAYAFAACWAIALILVWALHRQWWRVRAVRHALWIVPVIVFASILLWGVSARGGSRTFTNIFAVVSGFGVTAALGLVFALPFSGAALSIERLGGWLRRRKHRDAEAATASGARPADLPSLAHDHALRRMHAPDGSSGPARDAADSQYDPAADLVADGARTARDAGDIDRGRRSFLTTAAAALPLLTVSAAGAGVAQSYGRTRFPNVPLHYPELPADLEGLRILHLSDIHLGYFVGLEDLERTMIDAEAQRPDVILLTGDVSDDLRVLPEALRMIGGLKTRYGTFASIGNHEYYRGIEEVLRAFDAGPVPMLIDAASTIAVGSSSLHIAGADDPARTGRFNNAAFLRGTVERAIDGMPSDAFTILMSHRPEGFDVASAHGVDLTLSGHYHGGIQLGLGGRAIIQGFAPEKYYWGHYSRGSAQLYTSGGVGHWFPFRLNCPPEAPVYVLRRTGPSLPD